MHLQILLAPTLWSAGFKIFLGLVLVSGIATIVNAFLSAKTLGGELGAGLKKVAAGTISYIILFAVLVIYENRNTDWSTAGQMKFSFLFINTVGSLLLNAGYWQIYRISKKLKLF